jgi:hypothetical protein
MLAGVLGRTLSLVAILAALIVGGSFLFFVVDEVGGASRDQQHRIIDADVSPSELAEANRESRHTTARELVDDANDLLLRPFDGVVRSDSLWATRAVPALLGLAFYGIGIGFLARWLRARG